MHSVGAKPLISDVQEFGHDRIRRNQIRAAPLSPGTPETRWLRARLALRLTTQCIKQRSFNRSLAFRSALKKAELFCGIRA